MKRTHFPDVALKLDREFQGVDNRAELHTEILEFFDEHIGD